MELFRNRTGRGTRTRRIATIAATAATIALIATGCAAGGASGSERPASGDGGRPDDHVHPQAAQQPVHGRRARRRREGARSAGFASSGRRPARRERVEPRPVRSTPRPRPGTNVIVIAANDPDAVCSALEEARTGGAKIVAFDSDTNPDCRDVFISQVGGRGGRAHPGRTHRRADRRQPARSRSSRPPRTPPTRTSGSSTWRRSSRRTPTTPTSSSSPRSTATTTTPSCSRRPRACMQAYPNLKGHHLADDGRYRRAARYLATQTECSRARSPSTGLGSADGDEACTSTTGRSRRPALWDPVGAAATRCASRRGGAGIGGDQPAKVGESRRRPANSATR